tara:strand:+ start:3110 stop:3529 length:420 start_codon:yes stop_codon:yes gene_type:complete
MFNKIRNILSGNGDKHKEPPPEEVCEADGEEEVLGSITYYFKESSDDTFMDVHLSDFEEETLGKFAKIVSGLSSIRFQLETLQMIRDCFEDTEDEAVFNRIVVKMIEYTEEEADVIEKINKGSKSREEQPWIKPSDMIK